MKDEPIYDYVKRRGINLTRIIIRMIKKSPFEISGEQFLKFLDAVYISVDEKKEGNIGILLCPWLEMPLPWYSITLALLLKNEGYKNVSLVFNDLWLNYDGFLPYNNYKGQAKLIKKIICKNKIIKNNLNVIYLSTLQAKNISKNLCESISKLSRIAAVRYFEGSGNYGTFKYKKMESCFEDIFDYFAPYFECFVTKYNWDKLIIPGGLFLESGLLLECAVENNVAVVTYDASFSSAYIGNITPAARLMDIPSTVETLKECINPKDIYFKAMQIMQQRRAGKADIVPWVDSGIIQTAQYGNSRLGSYDIAFFLNIESDAAALGAHGLFENDYQWITETLEYLIHNSNFTIVIREHPMQRNFGRTKLSEIIHGYTKNERVHYYEYDADVNSYDLIEQSKVILVLASTVGMEAAMCGKRVVLESNCYYSGASFVKHAKNREEYFQYIIDAVNEDSIVSEEKRWEAGLYYYLTQKYGSIRTTFLPQPNGFDEWVQKDFQDIASDEKVKIILKALMDGEPLCLKLYNREVSYEI